MCYFLFYFIRSPYIPYSYLSAVLPVYVLLSVSSLFFMRRKGRQLIKIKIGYLNLETSLWENNIYPYTLIRDMDELT